MEENPNQQEQQQKTGGTSSKKYLAVIGLLLVITIIGVIYESQTKQKTETTTPTQKKMTVSSPQVKSTFKDGTYSAQGDYTVHIGQKHIKVTITLKNDIITDADVKNEADDPVSVRYQDSFISGYKQYVIGKEISSVHLSKVSRSSLTSNGFNSALELIKSQAKS